MEHPRTVIQLDSSKLYQTLTKLEERYISKMRDHSETGAPMQIPGPDLKEMVKLFEDYHEAALKVLLLHGAYVGGVMVINKRLTEFFIGKTGPKLTQEQFEVLNNCVNALATMNKIHTELPEKEFDLNTIHKYLNL